MAPYKAYRASDDYLIIAAGNDNLYRRLCPALGHPEWIDDPRFRTNAGRIENRRQLNALVEEAVAMHPRAYWLDRLEAAGVPCAPLQSIDEVLAHPQTQSLRMLQRSPDGRFLLMGLPLSFDGVRPPFRRAPPALGEHNAELFQEAPSAG